MTDIPPSFVTFTGVDDFTNLADMIELSTKYPIEWGVLVGGKIGKARYPSDETIGLIENISHKYSIRFSKHLCGDYAKSANRGALTTSVKSFDRFQINSVDYDMNKISNLCEFGRPIVIQWRNLTFPEKAFHPFFNYLFDKSGGKSKLAEKYPTQPDQLDLVGYAGGINPDNVLSVIDKIDAYNYWIDMETGVRTDDRFDLTKCEQVCKQIWGMGNCGFGKSTPPENSDLYDW